MKIKRKMKLTSKLMRADYSRHLRDRRKKVAKKFKSIQMGEQCVYLLANLLLLTSMIASQVRAETEAETFVSPIPSDLEGNQSVASQLQPLDSFPAEMDEFEIDEAPVALPARVLWRRQTGEHFGLAQLEPLADYDSYRPLSDFESLPLNPSAHLSESASGSLQQQQQQLQVGAGHLRRFASQTAAGQLQQQKMGPQFIKEPPSFIHYLNSSDLVIQCAASGNPAPTISWWHRNVQIEIGSLLDKRYVRYDNSLVISAFKANHYEPDIHSTAYRCQASNAFGSIVSRDVVINAVIDQDYEVSVADQFVTVDNDALFRCQLPPQARDLFQVIGWLEDGQHLIQALASQQQQQQQRAIVLPDGQLYIRRVQLKDANKSYRCQIRNLLNSKVSLSSISGRLFVTDANEQSGTSPRIVDSPKAISVAKLNEQLLLSCLAQGSPRPTIRWFRWSSLSGSGQQQQQIGSLPNGAGQQSKYLAAGQHRLEASEWVDIAAAQFDGHQAARNYLSSFEGNLLLIRSVQLAEHRARFKCVANNSFGAHQAETELQLDVWPANKLLDIEPKVEHIQVGELRSSSQSVVFNCTIRQSSTQPVVAIEWLRNGRPLFLLALPQFVAQLVASSASSSSLSSASNSPIIISTDGYTTMSSSGMDDNATMQVPASLFEDPSQELSAIEHYWVSSSSSNSQEQGLGEMGAPDRYGQPVDSSLELISGQQQVAVSGETTNYLVHSTSLNKMLNLDEQSIGRRPIRQRARMLASQLQADQLAPPHLLYQLVFEQVRRTDRGSYQCRARTANGGAQHATSHLMLKDNPPQFVETFTGQLITRQQQQLGQQPHQQQQQQNQILHQQHSVQVSLKCVAAGSPLPEISWTLSGFPVPESNRFRVGDYVTRDGLIVSFVNISNVQNEDGGLYECSATNDIGQLKHSAWLNITGPPFVRPMPSLSAIAGSSLAIMCPVGGWPIEQISWFQNSSKLPANHRQKLFPNGTLLISELNEITDTGQYSCQAKSALAQVDSSSSSSSSNNINQLVAVNHLQITIKVPPIVEPFSFAKSLHRGQRYNIMCTVVRGDLPVTIRWFKDGRAIEQASSSEASVDNSREQQQQQSINGGIAIKHLDPYSSTLTFASLQSHHRGQYSCEAANEAGRTNQSSTLVIHVPPEWRLEPKDLSVTVGRTAVIDCQADAFPAARIEWRLSQDLFREPPTEFKPIISSLYMRVFENGSLIIYNSQRTDAGYYLCQANNGVGPGLSRVVKLTVHVAAHFKSKIRTELVRRGQPARLKCESIGDPPIEISWLRDKMPLYAADEPRFALTKTLLPDGILSELSIPETERSDSALFTCISQNAFGNDDTNVQLIVQSVPDPPLDIRIHEYEARSVKISWLLGHSGNSPILKYLIMYGQVEGVGSASGGPSNAPAAGNYLANGQANPSLANYANVTIPANESSLLLQNLTPLTEYQFYMLAQNLLGWSKLSNEPIKFRTDDEAPAAPPQFVKALASSSSSIKVRWRPPERRAHYGSITGFYVGYKQLQTKRALGSGSSSSALVSTNQAAESLQVAANQRDTFIYKTVELSSNAGALAQQQQQQLEQECVLQQLRRGQRYLITVQAFNGRGAGPASEPIIASTWRVDVPEPPLLRMVARSAHSIHLAWRLAGAAPSRQVGALIMRKHLSRARQQLPAGEAAALSTKASTIVGQTTMASSSSGAPPGELVDGEAAASEEDDEDDELDNVEGANGSGSGSNKSREQQRLGADLDADEAQANEPILGFVLTRKQMAQIPAVDSVASSPASIQQMGAIEMRLPSDHLSQIVDNLNCGTRYQFTIAALNSVGSSPQSDPLIVKTEGSTPVAPDRSSLLSLNSSSVLIHLSAWHNGACPMRSFDVAFRASRAKKWTSLANYQFAGQSPEGKALAQNSSSSSSEQKTPLASSNQLVQRSVGAHNQRQLANEIANQTLVLDDLSSSLLYELRIVATNEAGATEAMYTFSLAANGEFLDNRWPPLNAPSADFPLSDSNLAELIASTGPIFPWLLSLLFVSLALSAGCLLVGRRRRASSSSCSLSLSSASRSNQSSSNYYTSNQRHQLESSVSAGLTGSGSATKANLLNSACQTMGRQNRLSLHANGFHPALAESPAAGQLQHSSSMQLLDEQALSSSHHPNSADIYGHEQQQQTHLTLVEASHGKPNGASYGYLAARTGVERAPSPLASVINGSEAEMCLGASALNIATSMQQQQQQQQQQQHHHHHDHNQLEGDKQAVQQRANNNEPVGYYMAPTMLIQAPKLQQQHLAKSSTLPSNCHQQIVLQHLFQQQSNDPNQQQQRQMLDTLMAANNIIQQQCANGNNPDQEAYQSQQDSNGMAALIEAQLQQQVYATVKRGCPRPPRPCDYAPATIYSCPGNPGNQPEVRQQQQQQLSMLRCCAELANVSSLNEQPVCYHQLAEQQNCQQPQTSDYQQLRPIN